MNTLRELNEANATFHGRKTRDDDSSPMQRVLRKEANTGKFSQHAQSSNRSMVALGIQSARKEGERGRGALPTGRESAKLHTRLVKHWRGRRLGADSSPLERAIRKQKNTSKVPQTSEERKQISYELRKAHQANPKRSHEQQEYEAGMARQHDVSHPEGPAGPSVHKRGGQTVVEHDEKDPFRKRSSKIQPIARKFYAKVKKASERSLKASGVQSRAGKSMDTFPATDKSIADVQRANDSFHARKVRDQEGRRPGARWYHHSTVGENRKFELHEGAGTVGGQWMTKGPHAKGGREVVIHNSKQEALEHIHHSQE